MDYGPASERLNQSPLHIEFAQGEDSIVMLIADDTVVWEQDPPALLSDEAILKGMVAKGSPGVGSVVEGSVHLHFKSKFKSMTFCALWCSIFYSNNGCDLAARSSPLGMMHR